jgi:enoyl-CoA hydratase/carnithine racemase
MIFTIDKVSESYWKVFINNPPVNILIQNSPCSFETMEELEANENLKVVVFESANPDFYVAHAELIDIFNFQKGQAKQDFRFMARSC